MAWTLLFVLLAVAIVSAFRMRARSPAAQPLLVGLLVLALALSFVRLSCSGQSRATTYDPAPERALGRIAAEEFARITTERRMVVIAQPDTGRRGGGQFLVDAFLEAAQAEGIEIVARLSPMALHEARISDPERLEEVMLALMDVGMDASSVQYAVEQYPDVRVIVSLAGVPSSGLARVPGIRDRKILAIDWFSTGDWMPAMEAGLLDAVIAYRDVPGPAARRRSDARAIFDRDFLLVTPETLGSLRDGIRISDAP